MGGLRLNSEYRLEKKIKRPAGGPGLGINTHWLMIQTEIFESIAIVINGTFNENERC